LRPQGRVAGDYYSEWIHSGSELGHSQTPTGKAVRLQKPSAPMRAGPGDVPRAAYSGREMPQGDVAMGGVTSMSGLVKGWVGLSDRGEVLGLFASTITTQTNERANHKRSMNGRWTCTTQSGDTGCRWGVLLL
jgi:hypothetical protein